MSLALSIDSRPRTRLLIHEGWRSWSVRVLGWLPALAFVASGLLMDLEARMSSSLVKSRCHAFHLQSGVCFYCEAPMWLTDPDGFAKSKALTRRLTERLQCTAEHLTARAEGGGASRENIVAVCLHCNKTRHRAKHPRDPAAYRKLVKQRLGAGRWHPSQIRRLLVSGRPTKRNARRHSPA
jgi:hypothetical protein